MLNIWRLVSGEVISQWFSCPKILLAMKYWEMAVHRFSWPETLITMVKSSVTEQRISRPKIFNLCDFVFYDCLENFWIWNIYLMVDGFMFWKRIPRPKMKTYDVYVYECSNYFLTWMFCHRTDRGRRGPPCESLCDCSYSAVSSPQTFHKVCKRRFRRHSFEYSLLS